MSMTALLATSLTDAHDYDNLFVLFLRYSMQMIQGKHHHFHLSQICGIYALNLALRHCFGEGLYFHAFFNLGTKRFIPCQDTKMNGKINDVMWGECLRFRFPAVWLVQWSYRSHTKVTHESNSKLGVDGQTWCWVDNERLSRFVCLFRTR
jgi:hypothetical protein